MLRTVLLTLLTMAAPLALWGCDDGASLRAIARMQREHDLIDPPQLWSVEVVDQTANGRPDFICANLRIVSGFFSILPTSKGADCARDRDMIPTPTGSRFRCTLDRVTYAVSSGVSGDRARDFIVSSSVHPLSQEGADAVRSLRFRRLGACPAGWRIGEATDQQGRRAMVFQESSAPLAAR